MGNVKGRLTPDKFIIIDEQFLNNAQYAAAVEIAHQTVSKMIKAGKLDVKKRGKNKGKIDVLEEKNLEYIKYRSFLLEKEVIICGKDPFKKERKNGRPVNYLAAKRQAAAEAPPITTEPKKERKARSTKTKNINSKDLREDFEEYIETLSIDGIIKEEKIQSIRKTKALADKAELELMEKRNLLFDRKLVEGYLSQIIKALFSKINNVPIANVEELITIVENDSDNARNRILDIMRDELVTVIEDTIDEVEQFFKENPIKSRKSQITEVKEENKEE